MRTSPFSSLYLAFLLSPACGGAEEEVPDPTAQYACLHIAEGTVVDISADRTSAPSLAIGREPYRVNLVSGQAGYLAIDLTAPTDLVYLADWADTLTAIWTDDERSTIDGANANPFCDEDIPQHYEVSLPAGTHQLEIGPVYQGNVWMMIAQP